MMTSPINLPAVQSSNAPGVCPECHRINPESAHFCTLCHHTLIYHCPKCWHEQRHSGTCDACHLDLEKYWRVYGVTEQAALMRQTHQSGSAPRRAARPSRRC